MSRLRNASPGRVVLAGGSYIVGADGEAKLAVVAVEPAGSVLIQVADTLDLFLTGDRAGDRERRAARPLPRPVRRP